MSGLLLFSDGSVNAQSKIGYGAYLAVSAANLTADNLAQQVKLRRFTPTSSSKLELQTLLWALSELDLTGRKLTIYTDSQHIIALPGRRARLEQNDYLSSKNRRFANEQLYKEFYRRIDQLDCTFQKVIGHQRAKDKNALDQLFTLVDRAARNALRSTGQPPAELFTGPNSPPS